MPPYQNTAGNLIVNAAGAPIECSTCPCGGGLSCCFPSLPQQLTMTFPTTVGNNACSNCNASFGNRAFVLDYTTNSAGNCVFEYDDTTSTLSCFGVGPGNFFDLFIGPTSGSTACTMSALVGPQSLGYQAAYSGTFAPGTTQPWTLNLTSGNFCLLSTSITISY